MTTRNEHAVVEPNARRRLVRGVFAVPAVLSVASGSAFAAASNFNCIKSISPFPPVYEGSTPPTTDTIIRIRVYKIGNDLYVRGEDVPTALLLNSATGFMTATQVWQFNVSTNSTVGDPTAPPNATAQARNYWAALRFNSTGLLVGVGRATDTDGWAITGSCWNSFG